LRTPNVTEDDLSPIWIGTEDDIRLKSAPPISVFERPDVLQREQPWEQKGIEAIPGEPQEETDLEEEVPPEGQAPVTPPQKPPEQPAVEEPKPQEPPAEETEAETSEQPTPEALVQTAPPAQQPPARTLPSEPPQTAPPAATAVVPPVPQQQGDQQPAVSSATILFNSININPKSGTDVVVNLQLKDAKDAGSLSIFLSFDPAAMQVKNVIQGPFVTPGAFSKSFDNARGTIQINASRTPSGDADGTVATIVLTGLHAGKATLNLNSAVIRNPSAGVIPVTFLPYTIAFE
jgi:hypothetical protein